MVYAPDLALAALRGNPHHDSKGRFAAHSGDGGSRGIRDSLAQASTMPELEAAASAELGGILGRRVAVDMRGMDVETARVHLEGVARGAEMFPHTDLISVSTYGPGGVRAHVGHPDEEKAWGITDSVRGRAGADIAFNTRISAAKMRDITQRAHDGGLVHGNPRDITRTGSHEFGHAAAASLYPGVAQSHAVDTLRVHGRNDPYGHLFASLSRYAGTSPDELLGEAVAQVATEGSGASGLAKDIVGGMQKHWDAWKL